MSIEEKLASMGITIPPCPVPVAAYVPGVRSGNLIYVSGQLPMEDGALVKSGPVTVDGEVTVPDGQEAARICAINALSVVKDMMGSLEAIKRVVQVQGFVACKDDFIAHPMVINGASQFLVDVFGESGKHSRFAVGVPSLPLGASVEISFIFQV